MMIYLHRRLSAFYRPIFSQHRIFRNLYLSALMSDFSAEWQMLTMLWQRRWKNSWKNIS